MKKDILGIKIDDVSLDEALKIVEVWLQKAGKHFIVTPNPEFIVAAREDLEFKKILNSADLSIPDGVGLKLSGDIVCNTPGIDLMEDIIKSASEKGFTVGFLGGEIGIAEKCSKRLKKQYPNLKITYVECGGKVDLEGNGSDLAIPKTDILFVAFGFIKQEKWIYKNLPKIPIKVAMGVGGAFDYLSGTVPRAPLLIRNFGLEWLFRLVLQPWRIKRQLSLVKFVIYLLLK